MLESSQKRFFTCLGILTLPDLFLILLTPRPHGVHDRFQAAAEVGQGIFHARRDLRVHFPCQKSALLHLA